MAFAKSKEHLSRYQTFWDYCFPPILLQKWQWIKVGLIPHGVGEKGSGKDGIRCIWFITGVVGIVGALAVGLAPFYHVENCESCDEQEHDVGGKTVSCGHVVDMDKI
jgi:hypothetical protein